jgi:hypothetical protein
MRAWRQVFGIALAVLVLCIGVPPVAHSVVRSSEASAPGAVKTAAVSVNGNRKLTPYRQLKIDPLMVIGPRLGPRGRGRGLGL